MKLYSYYQKNTTNNQAKNEDWKNLTVNDMLLYSHRNTLYDAESFPSNLHYHDYFELILIEEGNIRYICESLVYYPQKGDIILIPPGKFHMSAINGSETRYNRHVFYFYPGAFDAYGCSFLCDFAKKSENGALISFSEPQKNEAAHLLHGIRNALSVLNDKTEYALGISYVLQFFYLLNKKTESSAAEVLGLPENILELKNYIDRNYSKIDSVSDVAKQFFYSREHTSRLFKKHFDISISNYILQRRILESRKMILDGISITDTAYSVGFKSLSAFICSFRKINGMSPSEYKKAHL